MLLLNLTACAATATELPLRKAEAGDARAQAILARAYFMSGLGVQRDFEQAAHWAKLSSGQHHPLGLFMLGQLYETGAGVVGNIATSKEYYSRSLDGLQRLARNNDPIAQCDLGYVLAEGKLGKKNFAGAIEWYKKAAAQDFARGVFELASIYRNGKGVTTDTKRALKLYGEAAEKNYSDALFHLGIIHGGDDNVPEDKHKSYQYFLKAANLGHHEAQFHVGVMLYRGTGTRGNANKGLAWLKKSILQGNEQAVMAYGFFLREPFRVGS
jgi:TPR repeat protein